MYSFVSRLETKSSKNEISYKNGIHLRWLGGHNALKSHYTIRTRRGPVDLDTKGSTEGKTGEGGRIPYTRVLDSSTNHP